MTLSTLSFLLAAVSLCLLRWSPADLASRALRGTLIFGAGFLALAFLLGGLLTLWWPPKMPFVVLWSSASLVLLAGIALRQD
jgi:hypothetical protein